VCALVGPNGAGKSTLLQLAAGLLAPSAGEVRVFGARPVADRDALARVAFLGQGKPLYPGFTVAETLRLGAALNPRWDGAGVRARLDALGIGMDHKVGQLSGGQRAQVALSVALGKRSDLLILDEPVAELDPLARRDLMATLMEAVADTGMTVIVSSHVLAELEDVCDHLLLLAAGRIQLAGDIEEVLAEHAVVTGSQDVAEQLTAAGHAVVSATTAGRVNGAFARTVAPIHDPRLAVRRPSLEEIVLAYMQAPEASALPRPRLEVA
jgi:ABC-2 type transport system ATP-binding protein